MAVIGLLATFLMRGKASGIHDQAREEAKVDSLLADGETFEIGRPQPVHELASVPDTPD